MKKLTLITAILISLVACNAQEPKTLKYYDTLTVDSLKNVLVGLEVENDSLWHVNSIYQQSEKIIQFEQDTVKIDLIEKETKFVLFEIRKYGDDFNIKVNR